MPDPTLEEMKALIACQSGRGACTQDCAAMDTFCGRMDPVAVAATIRLLNRIDDLNLIQRKMLIHMKNMLVRADGNAFNLQAELEAIRLLITEVEEGHDREATGT